jgi:hypothetical protein
MAMPFRSPFLCFALVMVGVIHCMASQKIKPLVRSGKRMHEVNIDAYGPVIDAHDPFEGREVQAATESSSSLAETNATLDQNCGGSMSIDPRYCIGSEGRTCTHDQLQVNEFVPLRIRVRNKANYDNFDGDSVYVPAKLQAGKRIQIVFACEDQQCNSAHEDVFQYVGIESEHEGSTFTPGAAPGFTGINKCSGLDNPNLACGYITLGSDIPIAGQGSEVVAFLHMRAVKKVPGTVRAHVSTDRDILTTYGGVCGREVTAGGSGTCQVKFAETQG